MFIIYGEQSSRLRSQNLQVTCPNCKQAGTTKLTVIVKYAHVFFVPFFPKGKIGLTKCRACGKEDDIDNMTLPYEFRKEFAEVSKRHKTPLWTYLGLGTSLAFIAFVAMVAISPKKKVPVVYKTQVVSEVYEEDGKAKKDPKYIIMLPNNMYEIAQTRFRSNDKNLNLEIFEVYKPKKGYSLSTHLKDYRKELSQRVTPHDIYETGVFKVSGMSAQTTRFDIREDYNTHSFTLIEGTNNIYIIHCWTPSNKWDDHKDMFLKVVQSFKLHT